MPEIIPNWHPMFVHYSIALLSISTLLFLVGTFTKNRWKETLLKTGHINLWLGAIISVGTVAAGLYASNTVAHDSASHAQMMNHRNWAIPTAGLFIILAIWSAVRYRKSLQRSLLFLGLMVIATGALAVTGFKGGELVYRHGTGVMSLPDTGTHDHSAHGHGEEENTSSSTNDAHKHEHLSKDVPEAREHDHGEHNHEH